MIADPIAVLEAIVAEVAGPAQPFSADSYLPPHLIHDARMAIEAEHKDAAKWKALEAHEALLLARLSKASEIISGLRAEIDALRHPKIPGQTATTKYEWKEDAVWLRGPKPAWWTVGSFDSNECTQVDATVEYKQFSWPEPVKYDPDACAESVRHMKECDA